MHAGIGLVEKRCHLRGQARMLDDMVDCGLNVEAREENEDGAIADKGVLSCPECPVEGLVARGDEDSCVASAFCHGDPPC